MTDITTLTEEELLADRLESENDILLCERALALRVYEINGYPVADRLSANRRIIIQIDIELKRREMLKSLDDRTNRRR